MSQPNHSVPRVAGVVLAAGALGFVAVFSVLAAQFGYPAVLDRPPSEVLPALLAGGAPLRLVWALYALLPFSIVIAAWGARGSSGLSPRTDRLVVLAGVLAGLSMSIGLARWPTLHWALALEWRDDPASRELIAERARLLDLVLGNGIGELLGELALSAWLAGIGAGLRGRWLGRALWALAALMLVGAFRNITSLVAPATEITNYLLPLVLLWLGGHWALRSARA